MPSRVVDGDAIARSQKLRQVPEKWRLHYPFWLTLGHPANGTFEVNPNLIHRDLYAFLLPSVTLSDVKRITRAFEEANLLKIWKQNGKEWGFFIGSDKPGRILPEKHRKRFKNLPPSCPGIFPEGSGVMPEGVGVGLGSGLGSRVARDASIALSEDSENGELTVSVRNTIRQFAAVWQELKGKGAHVPKPDDRFGTLSRFKELCAQHDLGLLTDAFRLWAVELGTGDDRYPLNSFVKVADEYLRKASPVKGFEERQKDPAEQARIDESIRLQREERARFNAIPEQNSTEPNPEDLFN